jgi:hypothetical protein
MNFKNSKIRWVMALSFALVITLAVVITITSIHGARATGSPTIASDQADYSPGATVTLTGAGWAAGDVVHIYVNDSVGNTWSLDSGQNGAADDPKADDNGGFTYSFTLPNTFIANYSATATDTSDTSVAATTTFTDSPPSNCPSTDPTKWLKDNQVGASFTPSGNTATYKFSSFVNENPVAGVPGLIYYCVYTTPLPTNITPQAVGVNNVIWQAAKSSTPDRFSFERPNGNDNIPLDGTTTTMGTATWSGSAPTSQVIVLHIDDSAECQALYGSSGSCFVLPGTKPTARDLTVSKTATPSFTRKFTWGISKSVDKTKIDIAKGGSATFNYTVNVTHDSGKDSGWQVTGTITVSNPNGFDVTGVNVTDDGVTNGGSCNLTTNGTNLTVHANSSVQVSYSCTYGSTPSSNSGTNKATATWPNIGSLNTSATDTATFDFGSVSPNVVDGCVTVTDTFKGNLGMVCSTDPSPTTFTYSRTESGSPGTCTDYANTATFTTDTTKTTGSDSKTVTVCIGADLTVSKTANPTFTRTFKWGITKSVDKSEIDIAKGGSATFNYTVNVTHDSGTDSNWLVTGKITVTNPNDWEAITADVSDAINDGGTCTVTGGTDLTITAGGSTVLDYTCNYASAPNPPSGTTSTNTATASWDKAAASTPTGTASGTADVDFSKATPTKVVDGSITVVDDQAGQGNPVPLGTASYTDPSPFDLNPYTLTFPGKDGTCTKYTNTATFTTKDTSTTGSDSKTVKVCVGVDLTVSKIASASFARTYAWSIAKSVDKTLVEQIGGTATFNYTVNVKETGFTDSGWQVNGTITVSNPNDWEAITADVTDKIDNNGNCTVTGGTGVSVPASSSVTLPYSCTYSSAPTPSSGTNMATATWDSAKFFTPDNSASGTAGYAFTIPTTVVNQDISVTDTFNGVTTTLGTAGPATDSTPFTSKTFTYSHMVNVPTSNCVKYTNTATIVDTGQTDSKTVEVCGPAKTGALTIGFWQNKNGQGIITGGASTAGVCNSGTWLRQYAPFQDLSATSSCSQVATYVLNIIKAANASGSSMNAMLKAQMLATALDVYFSNPSLGGNKINAPAPIDGVTIDLTKICAMIDGSGGTATCSSTFENVSSAFGGATSMTVSQMLAYAASQSDTGGVHWYGNVKATQQLAKDAFDAINNQVVFAP